MLTVDQTTRAYSGKRGCMCGCLGKYNEGLRARKLAITQLLKDPAVKLQTWAGDTEGCVFVETASRNRVLYLNEQGVAAVRAMGVAELKKPG
jgi:hypothetical protein